MLATLIFTCTYLCYNISIVSQLSTGFYTMANQNSISLETILNVLFGGLACLIAIVGVFATVITANKQRYQPADVERRCSCNTQLHKDAFSYTEAELEQHCTCTDVYCHAVGVVRRHNFAIRVTRQHVLQSLHDYGKDKTINVRRYRTITNDRDSYLPLEVGW